jgi:transposase
MESRYDPLKEEDFAREGVPLIEQHKKVSGRPGKISFYQFFCAILYVLRTGVPWRDVPERSGRWPTIYMRFKRWSESGLFWKWLYALREKKGMRIECAWIDRTTVAVHRPGSGALKK